MHRCDCGFRSTSQTFVAHGTVHCAECRLPLPLEQALYTGHDLLPVADATPPAGPENQSGLAEASDLPRSRVTAKSGRLASGWFSARPWR